MIQNNNSMKESVEEFCHKIGQDELVQGAGGIFEKWKSLGQLLVACRC